MVKIQSWRSKEWPLISLPLSNKMRASSSTRNTWSWVAGLKIPDVRKNILGHDICVPSTVVVEVHLILLCARCSIIVDPFAVLFTAQHVYLRRG